MRWILHRGRLFRPYIKIRNTVLLRAESTDELAFPLENRKSIKG